jgi:histidyl-tRNA synthetase
MLGTIADTFESFGFAPIDTPALERSDVLLGKYGDEGDKLLYRFRDNGDRDVALRYDLTVPLARVVAAHPDLPMPFRRYQIAKVWRAERPGRGRFREFTQCDVDLVGAKTGVADAECLEVIAGVLRALGVEKFRIRVNNRKLLNDVLGSFGVSGKARIHKTLRAVDKLDRSGPDRVCEELVKEAGWSESDAPRLLDVLSGNLDAAAALVPDSEGLAELKGLLSLAEAAGIREVVSPDLTIARGLDYYTGAIYETNLAELPGFGSVMSGGRYDDLLRDLCGRDLPAVGVSLGISRLFAGLQELGLVEGRRSPAHALMVWFGDDTAPATYAAAQALRREGISVLMHPGPAKIGKQFRLADKLGVACVLMVGADESDAGTVKVKWLDSGEQLSVPLADVGPHLRDRSKLIKGQ